MRWNRVVVGIGPWVVVVLDVVGGFRHNGHNGLGVRLNGHIRHDGR